MARGQNPVPGQDARVELLFSKESKFPIAAGAAAKINFRERYAFTCVEAGVTLARKTPAAPGKPGVDIHGQPVDPPPAKDVTLKAGRGVMLTENDLTAVSVRTGRPKALFKQGEVTVEISPVFFHPGNVDLSSGNIYFKGDVFIEGNVCEGMCVEALEDVQVGGYVAHSLVQAGGSIFVQGNVLSSALVAGGKEGFLVEGISLLKEFSTLVARFKKAIEQLQQNPAFSEKEIKRAVPLLLETRFKEIPEYTKRLTALVSSLPKEAVAEELSALTDAAQKVFAGLPSTLEPSAHLELIAEMANQLLGQLPASYSRKVDVNLSYALNSIIRATGNVRVFGNGCFNTSIHAGGNVLIRGVFRGGEIYSRRNVSVGELGSRRGMKTRVRVTEDGVVYLGRVWENAEVRVGKRPYVFARPENNVKVRLNKDKEIVVSRGQTPGRRKNHSLP